MSTLFLLLSSQPGGLEKAEVSVARKPEFEFHHLLAVGSRASNTNFPCFGFFICPMGIICNLTCYVWCTECNICVYVCNVRRHPFNEMIYAEAFYVSYEKDRDLAMHNS